MTASRGATARWRVSLATGGPWSIGHANWSTWSGSRDGARPRVPRPETANRQPRRSATHRAQARKQCVGRGDGTPNTAPGAAVAGAAWRPARTRYASVLSLAPRPTVGGGDGMWWREQSWRRQWRRSGQACLGIPCNTQPLVYGSRTSSLGLWVDSHRECMHPSPADRLRGRSGRSRGRYRGSLRLLRRRK